MPFSTVPYRDFNEAELKDVFSYHPPTPEQRETYEKINAAFLVCAVDVAALMPLGPGRTAAIRALANARMQANAAVALEGKF